MVGALDQVLDEAGPDRAAYLLTRLLNRASHFGVSVPSQINTPYVNSIPVHEEVPYPGDRALERRIKSIIRWNAAAMVVRANKYDPNIGGHISTFASLAAVSRGGVQPRFPRQLWRSAGRFDLLPRPRFARHLFAGVSGRAAHGRAFAEFPS